MEQAKGGGGGGGGGDDGQDAAQRPARPAMAFPPLAQLKLLRDLQKDINHAHREFQKEHPDLKKLAGQGPGRVGIDSQGSAGRGRTDR